MLPSRVKGHCEYPMLGFLRLCKLPLFIQTKVTGFGGWFLCFVLVIFVEDFAFIKRRCMYIVRFSIPEENLYSV